LTRQILEKFKQQVDGLELIPSSGGRFELELDGELAYSKLDTGSFPDEPQILAMIAGRLG